MNTGKITKGSCYEAAAPNTEPPTRLQVVDVDPPDCIVQDAEGRLQSSTLTHMAEWAGRRVTSLDPAHDPVDDKGDKL